MKPRERPAASSRKASRPCPICGKPRDEGFAPFCSKRCSDVDLHRWLGGNYVLPGEPATGSDESDDEQ